MTINYENSRAEAQGLQQPKTSTFSAFRKMSAMRDNHIFAHEWAILRSDVELLYIAAHEWAKVRNGGGL